jgi:hypothetical protein
MSTLLEASGASNGTSTPDIVLEVLLPVFTTIGLTLLSILGIALALGLSYCVPALVYWISTFVPRKQHHRVGIAGCFFGIILLLVITAENTFPSDSFLSFVTKAYQVLYGVILVSCGILGSLAFMRVFEFGWKMARRDKKPFVTIDKDDEDGPTPNFRLLILVALALHTAAFAITLFGPWSPFLASNIDSLKIFGYALAQAILILATIVVVSISIDLTGRACLYICLDCPATDYIWNRPEIRERCPGIIDFPGLLLATFSFYFLIGFWLINMNYFPEMKIEWSILQLLIATFVMEGLAVCLAGIGKGVALLVKRAKDKTERTREMSSLV